MTERRPQPAEAPDGGARADLLGSVAHDLRTPIGAVLGMADVLLDTELDADQRECAETIRSSARTLLAQVEELLDFARIESGRLRLDEAPVDLRAVVDDVRADVEGEATEKGITLIAEVVGQEPPPLTGDPARLRNVLRTLARDALRVTPAGSVAIGAAARPAGGGRYAVEFRVQDTGPPIEAGEDEAIFRPGERDRGSRRVRRGGTGVGFSAARAICQRMGGTLRADGAPGGGAALVATAVLREAAPGRPHAPAAATGEDAAPPALRVLVAEDDPVSRRLALHLLGDLGCAVETVADGAEALEAVARGGHDLVLLDVRMPRKDGLEVARALRAASPAGKVPRIVGLTASTLNSERDACLAAGMDECLTKPLDGETLLGVLGRARPGAAAHVEASAEAAKARGRAAFAEVLELYLADTPQLIATLREAADRDATERLVETAHKLRGSSAAVGAGAVLALATVIERNARAGDLVAARAAVATLAREWPATRAELVERLDAS